MLEPSSPSSGIKVPDPMKKIFRTRDYDPNADRDIEEEFRSHLELKVEDLMAQGMSREEARA